MIIVAGTILVKPEKYTDAVAAMSVMSAETQKEHGCVTYQFYEDITTPNQFLVYEIWESTDDLKAHSKSDHMGVFRQQMGDILAAPTDIHRYRAEEFDQF